MKKASTPENLRKLAQKNHLFWKISGEKGLLEYRKANVLRMWLISSLAWGVVALFPLLTGNPGLVRLICERQDNNTGSCRHEKIYLHPFLIPFSHSEDIAISDIQGASLNEIQGDESDSYQFLLNTRQQNIPLFTALFESTAEQELEKLQDFLTQKEDRIKIRYFDLLFFWLMYAPLYMMVFWTVIIVLRKLSGRPVNCHWTIFDNTTRQLVILYTSSLGLSKTSKHPLNSIQALEIKESKSEQGDFFQYVARLKSGKALMLTPQLPVKAGQDFEEMQNWLLHDIQTLLTQLQQNPAKSQAN